MWEKKAGVEASVGSKNGGKWKEVYRLEGGEGQRRGEEVHLKLKEAR